MLIIGCDYHPSFQQIALVDTETGEVQERRLGHREEAEQFYRALATAGAKVRVGMEASGHAGWFERLLAELNIELWMGDAAKIAAKRVRKPKTDRRVESRTGAGTLVSRWLLTTLSRRRLSPVWLGSVSCSRSSNRTGRFPVSGSRKRRTPKQTSACNAACNV